MTAEWTRKLHTASRQMDLFVEQPIPSFNYRIGGSSVVVTRIREVKDGKRIIKDFISNSKNLRAKLDSSNIVLIKPNITSGERPEIGKTSSPEVLYQLVNSLFELGIPSHKIIVADSSVIGVDTLEAAKTGGISEVCDELGLTFMDLNSGPFEEKEVPKHIHFPKLQVHELAVANDVFRINLAKIKTTYGSPVGFCIKNLKGLITNEHKLEFHLFGVQESLVDLRKVMDFDLNILEGFPANELGLPVDIGILGISENDVILDMIVAELVGIRFKEVPHLEALVRMYLGKDTDFEGNQEFHALQSTIPRLRYSSHGIEDFNQRFALNLVDGQPCSSCIESFYKAIEKTSERNLAIGDVTYVLGAFIKGDEQVLENVRPIAFVGDCAYKTSLADACHKEIYKEWQPNQKGKVWTQSSFFIPGCPPTIDSMKKELLKMGDTGLEEEDIDILGSFEKIRKSEAITAAIRTMPINNYNTGKLIRQVIELTPEEKVVFNSLGRRNALQGELITAAICHQIDWDFLRLRLKKQIEKAPLFFTFENLSRINSKDILMILEDYKDKTRIRADERAKMLNELGKLREMGVDYFSDLMEKTRVEGTSEGNVIEILKKLKTFGEDPEGRKIQVLIHSLMRTKLWQFKEEEIFQPAIDYHTMRLYIRRGNIWPRNKLGEEYIRKNATRRSTTTSALRAHVAEAMKDIAFYSGSSIVDVNRAEWWVGRSICTRTNLKCELKNMESASWLKDKYSACPYIDICVTANQEHALLDVMEPREKSNYY